MSERYDLVVVGTGFASSFFLHGYLRRYPRARVLVLEKGPMYTHARLLELRRTAPHELPFSQHEVERHIDNRTPEKRWVFDIGFGGGSTCWTACTPRFMPNDFRTQSLYGVGTDWPVSYDELESYYCDAEDIMAISGPEDTPFPRSRPYPQPPHRFSEPDRVLKKAYPTLFIQQPTARPRVPTPQRAACFGNSVCAVCPIDAKFTVANELKYLYEAPNVSLQLGAQAEFVETRAGTAERIVYTQDGRRHAAAGELFVLGANAIFNPWLLLRSGFTHPRLGKGLNEQLSVNVDVYLDGMNNFQGSTLITGQGYMLYDGAHRREHAGCIIETFNEPRLRFEKGKWRQRLFMKFIFEDLPSMENAVSLSSDGRPAVRYRDYSDYTKRGIAALKTQLPKLLAPLPVEQIYVDKNVNPWEAHVQGTVPMGNDPATSLCDKHSVHHRVRNLLVLGSSSFPTCPPANPTLTIAALSLLAADHV